MGIQAIKITAVTEPNRYILLGFPKYRDLNGSIKRRIFDCAEEIKYLGRTGVIDYWLMKNPTRIEKIKGFQFNNSIYDLITRHGETMAYLIKNEDEIIKIGHKIKEKK